MIDFYWFIIHVNIVVNITLKNVTLFKYIYLVIDTIVYHQWPIDAEDILESNFALNWNSLSSWKNYGD